MPQSLAFARIAASLAKGRGSVETVTQALLKAGAIDPRLGRLRELSKNG